MSPLNGGSELGDRLSSRHIVTGKRLLMSTSRDIRMFNEYTCHWPFWGEEGLLDENEFPLPPDLTRRVHAWTRDFDLNYDDERGWPSVEHREASHQEGLRLAEEVQAVVGPETTIDFQYWETVVDGRDPNEEPSEG